MEERVKPPAGISLSPLATQVFAVLAEYTSFPWPVLLAQSRRVGVDPATLDRNGLRQLVPFLSAGVERFTSPEKGRAVQDRLHRLLES